jgi:2-polyprenyl-6-hydroxyphenyl methylase/3-demethylubiquinone-9 3-methyltransferase
MQTQAKATFSFGANWKRFVRRIDKRAITMASQDLDDWLGGGARGKRVIDIGSGSGLSSLAFVLAGAAEVLSIDLDPKSVEATECLRSGSACPSLWKVRQGSVLDAAFLASTGKWDIVYSWGVLHHTGDLWAALDNAAGLVAPGGLLWISIYTKGPRYPDDLALKQAYNRASYFGKKYLEWRWIARLIWDRLKSGQNPFNWNRRVVRGMDVYHDLVDWLGGLPYEVATVAEVTDFCIRRGLRQERVLERCEGACSTYLFRRPCHSQTSTS